jgi:hypothetical protein
MVYAAFFWIVFAGCCLLPAVLHLIRPLYDGGICAAPEFPPTIEELPASPAEREPDILKSSVAIDQSSTQDSVKLLVYKGM